MAKLTPVKRVDKNGVLTTKHVREDTGKKSPVSTVPPPSIDQPHVTHATARPYQKKWRIKFKEWGECDPDLRFVCDEYYSIAETYECSDVEAYDVTTVINPGNVLPLLAIGIRSSDEARKFLTRNHFDHLLMENSLAEQAIARDIRAKEFIGFSSKYPQYAHHDTFIDAAECWSDPSIKDADRMRPTNAYHYMAPITELVLDSKLSWSDVKEIGVERFALQAMHSDKLVDLISRIKSGDSGLKSLTEVAEMLSVERIGNSLIIADTYGLEGLKKMPSNISWHATRLASVLNLRKHSLDERFAIFEYAQEVGLHPSPEDLIQLFDAGISHEEARLGIFRGLAPLQIIGIHNGEVEPSVSSGYL